MRKDVKFLYCPILACLVGPASRSTMKISREDVLRVAELAHLEFSPEEVELYGSQLDEILSYIGKLEELRRYLTSSP